MLSPQTVLFQTQTQGGGGWPCTHAMVIEYHFKNLDSTHMVA